MLLAKDWKDYEVLDTGDGEKLERWKDIILQRPDGQVIWPKSNPSLWNKSDAIYHRSDQGGGRWEFKKTLPKSWNIKYKDLVFKVEPTGFKHTGLFPEQSANWDFCREKLSSLKSSKVLNLFAYTGAASVACASAGAEVVHVDASKGMNEWAKENASLNGLNTRIRFITEDVKKFVQREIRRGNKYEGIIMDPPVYGRGPKGELWEIEKEIKNLVMDCEQLLSKDAVFFLINSYTSSITHTGLKNLLSTTIMQKGSVESGEISIPIKSSNLVLPCGIYARWSR